MYGAVREVVTDGDLERVPMRDVVTEAAASREQRQQEQQRWQAIRFHDRLARVHRDIAAEHEVKAERLIQAGRKGVHR